MKVFTAIAMLDAWLVSSFSPLRYPPTPRNLVAVDLAGKADVPLRPALPNDYQDVGNTIIEQACATVASTAQADIEWKGDHIIVTLRGEEVYLSAIEADEDVIMDGEEIRDEEDSVDEDWDTSSSTGVDVTTVAKAINAALDCNEVGQAIAETHSIEVTTPGASDELQGDTMFAAYQGFDVIIVYDDPKKNKRRTIEGRLVERTDEHVVINIKGRITKLIRDNVISVKLPKAKREK